MGNTAQQCRLGLFQDSDFDGDLEDSKSTSSGTLCVFGSHTFVPISWMSKKQTCVWHISTESEIISLDAGSRVDGIPALDLWDLVIDVLPSKQNQKQKSSKRGVTRCPTKHQEKRVKSECNTQILQNHVQLSNVCLQTGAILFIFEDNAAAIKMIIKSRSPTQRHSFKNHRVAPDGSFDRIKLDPRSKSSVSHPKINSQTFWLDEISHVMNGTTFCVCSTTAFSVLTPALKPALKIALRPRRRDCRKVMTSGSSPNQNQ